MEFIDKQIAPPKHWEKFEELTRGLFAKIWNDPLAQKHGRSGQKQHGVDVFGTPAAALGTTCGVQCKGKDSNYGAAVTTTEFDSELAKADKFSPRLSHWTLATTAPNDAALQRHAQQVSEARVRAGRFPVTVIGWETIQALISEHSQVIEQFYPEHSDHLPAVLAALRNLPSALDLRDLQNAILAVPAPVNAPPTSANWSEITFAASRDIGPALMGRALGPADVAACPVLPETTLLLADLARAGSARLAGVPGAGKSISILQAARHYHGKGYRVLRLDDPSSEALPAETDAPTLFVVDDAHLARPAFLRSLEELATPSTPVLSAHTVADGKASTPGTIQLDVRRAVRVIAEGLRAAPTTLAAVRRADDRVGDRPGDERLDHRLEHAVATAEFPWQFCFILGGGWRRADAYASSARAAGCDLVLAAAAARQLGMRDARCSHSALAELLDGIVSTGELERATDWLVGQRLFLTDHDLRCPHQRLAGVLLIKVLEGQTIEGREAIAEVLQRVLSNTAAPVGGIAQLLRELDSRGAEFGRWRSLVQREWLDTFMQRCWDATSPGDIRDACWALCEVHGYAADQMELARNKQEVLVSWISGTPKDACYAIGRLVNHIYGQDENLGRAIAGQVDPAVLALAISRADALHASEIASLVLMMRMTGDSEWKTRYLRSIDRTKLLHLSATWPSDAWISSAAELCKHFTYFDPEFGFQLIEALIPAIADRLRHDPQEGFLELNDIVWDSLRLHDPLGVFVGKLAPTGRMRQVGRKIAACWSPGDLAAKLSLATPRTFQSAGGLLRFISEVAPAAFESTVLALDWSMIEKSIGADWSDGIGDARILLSAAYRLPEARAAIRALVARNESKFATMSAFLAAVAPESAFRHVTAGKTVAISYSGHVDWGIGCAALIPFIEKKRYLVSALIDPHIGAIGAALSQRSPTFYNQALLFLRLADAAYPTFFQKVLDRIDPGTAATGWRYALSGRENNRVRGRRSEAKQVAALLVAHALERRDSVGDLARALRKEFPAASSPRSSTTEPIELPDDQYSAR